MAFECLQGCRLSNLSGQPVPVFDHPHRKKKCFLMLRQSLLCPLPKSTHPALSNSSLISSVTSVDVGLLVLDQRNTFKFKTEQIKMSKPEDM